MPVHPPEASAETRRAPDRARVFGIAPDGWPVIAAVGAAGVVVTAAWWWVLPTSGPIVAIGAAIVLAWSLWFFRDPRRASPFEEAAVISPADGVVSAIVRGPPPPEAAGDDESLRESMTRISVFMNIFNVHVNRSPVAGIVRRIAYRPGRFFNASFDKASEHNERLSLVLETASGAQMVVVQIAGLIARRIVCHAKPGDALAGGERFGLIRFGSRVDVYLPSGGEPCVRIGQSVTAGLTILAHLPTVAAAEREHVVPTHEEVPV